MIYLCSVYSLDAKTDDHAHESLRYERYLFAMQKTAEYLQQGHIVFSPITHCHVMANMYHLPKDYKFWQHMDRGMIDASDEVWVLKMDGWERSEGITDEIAYAESLGKPVKYIEV